MLGRTHLAGALAAASAAALVHPPAPAAAPVLAACALAGAIGGLAPDLDRPGSSLWRRVPAGGLLAWLARPAFVGGHRHLSHSLLGAALFMLAARPALRALAIPTTDAQSVLTAFGSGYLSHLVLDSLTEGGVPWLFPLPWRMGFPPFRSWRLCSGGWFERGVVLPVLCAGVLWLWYGYLSALSERGGRPATRGSPGSRGATSSRGRRQPGAGPRGGGPRLPDRRPTGWRP